MTQGHKSLVIVQRPCLLLVISTPRLANQSHDSVPLKIISYGVSTGCSLMLNGRYIAVQSNRSFIDLNLFQTGLTRQVLNLV